MALRFRGVLLLNNFLSSRSVFSLRNANLRNDFQPIRFVRTTKQEVRRAPIKNNSPPKPTIQKVQLELPTFDAILEALEKDLRIASNLIQQRADAGQPVTAKIYSKLFKALGKLGNPIKLEHFFNQMQSRNVPRDLVVYHKILEGLENSLPHPELDSKISTFLQNLYNSLIQDRLIPQITTFHLLLNCAILCQNDSLVSLFLEGMRKFELKNDKTICNLLIKYYENDSINFFRIWDEMREKRFVPNSKSYAIVIGHFLKQKDNAMALKHFLNMKSESVSPDLETYNAVMQVMAENEALHNHMIPTFQDLLRQNLKPNADSFKALMLFYYSHKNITKMKEMWDKMIEKSITPTSEACFYLIDALVQQGDMPGAITYYEIMKRKGIKPSVPILVTLGRSVIKRGNLKALESFKKEVSLYANWSDVEARVLYT